MIRRENPGDVRMTPIRVVALTAPGAFYAPLLLRPLLDSPEIQLQTVCVLHGRGRSHTIRQRMYRTGTLYMLHRAAALMSLKLRNLFARQLFRRKAEELPCPELRDLLTVRRFPIWNVPSVNDRSTLDQIQEMRPDIILSLFIEEILSSDVLGIPQFACINLHPSKLPAFAGTNPVFWVLAKGQNHTGLTAHVMSEEPDAGDILFQTHVTVDDTDTHHTLYRRICCDAGPRLRALLEQIRRDQRLPDPVTSTESPSRFSTPTADAYREFRSRGARFI